MSTELDYRRPCGDDDPRSAGHCSKHGDYNGRFIRCPYCEEAKAKRARQEIAEELHNAYERLAAQEGWKTQAACQVPFNELPPANRRVMLGMADYVINRERLVREETVEACALAVCPLCRYAADPKHDGIPIAKVKNGSHRIGEEGTYWYKDCATNAIRALAQPAQEVGRE